MNRTVDDTENRTLTGALSGGLDSKSSLVVSVDGVLEPDAEEAVALSFHVVAMGASAGGLEAFTRLLQNLPSDTGMAFVLIQHLAPRHNSILSTLLARATSMPVVEVEHGTPVEPNHVFVIPPNKFMTISQGVLELAPRPEVRGMPMPIDHFFRSLAVDQKALSIGVVLSGTASDGALGLQSIRAEGGIAIAQSEDSAKYGGMPHDALGAGPVDLVLPPEEIARELARIARSPSRALQTGLDGTESADEDHLNRIFAILRTAVAVDFQAYKRPTIQRRISRRILMKQKGGLAEYADFLETDPAEVMALSEDLLIHVTSFFRDAEVFMALENEILPKLLEDRSPQSALRVWAPGCASGEEVYSIAMCLVEAVSKIRSAVPIQIFGTDLSSRAIALARSATYQESQLAPISQERQERFFAKSPKGYQVVKSARDLCVFARQNLCQDPPYSRLDLISCRNVLIYLGAGMQRKVISTFQYALQPGGFLMLGKSEKMRGSPDLFTPVGKHHPFFQRNASSARPSLEFLGGRLSNGTPDPIVNANLGTAQRSRGPDFEKAAERIVLKEYGPPWVVVNERLEIVHARGDTSPYLQLPAGAPSFELLKMARESLRSELRNLLLEAQAENAPILSAMVLENIGGRMQRTGLEVRRITQMAVQGPCFLVVFLAQPDTNPERGLVFPEPGDDSPETELLRQELALTSQRLRAIIEDHDAANQELTSANEEIQSSNEELQSINEELETSKEELQSTNEELNTVNEELQNRNLELSRLGDDLTNLLSSTTIPILMLDNELRIRRMTPVAETILNLRPSDLGRPIGDIRMRLSLDDVEPVLRGVLETLQARELEVQDREGRWHHLRVRPFRTSDNRIEGVLLVLIDIHQVRTAQIEANAAREFAESVVESVQTPLLVLRSDLRIRAANGAFYQTYGMQPAQVENQPFQEIVGKQWAGLQADLEKVLPHQAVLLDREFGGEFTGRGTMTVSINARPIHSYGEEMILIAIEDITARKAAEGILLERQEQLKRRVEAGSAELRKTSENLLTEVSGRAHAESALQETEAALRRSRGELRQLTASLMNAQDAERRRVSRELHDDLSQKVAKLQFDIDTLEQKLPADLVEVKQRLCQVRDHAGSLSADLRRVAHQLHPATLDHLGLTVALKAYAHEFSESMAIPVLFTSRKVPRNIPIETASCFYRIAQEALRNVAKHAGKATVDVTLKGTSNGLELSIRDNGIGFNMESARSKEGLGLIGMEERIRLVGGKFSLETTPGGGVTITIQAPSPQETA
jgi:two-component system CheB/CheR fusion protein